MSLGGGVLVYVGAVAGGELLGLVGKYRQILAVQAQAAEAQSLKQSLSAYPHVQVAHGAVTNRHSSKIDSVGEKVNGWVRLNVASNPHSSSLGVFDPAWLAGRDLSMCGAEQVPVVDLGKLCSSHGIGAIDLLVSDAQGSDYDVLLSMVPWLERRAIKQIRCKTTKDGYGNVYQGLSPNELKSLRQLLQPLHYQLSAVGWGDTLTPGSLDLVPNDWWEFHSLWTPISDPHLANPNPTAASASTTSTTTLVTSVYDAGDGKDAKKEKGGGTVLLQAEWPMVVYCDEDSYMGAWRARSSVKQLDRTMFICRRRHHFAALAKRQPNSSTAPPSLDCVPQMLMDAIKANPFRTSHFTYADASTSGLSLRALAEHARETRIHFGQHSTISGPATLLDPWCQSWHAAVLASPSNSNPTVVPPPPPPPPPSPISSLSAGAEAKSSAVVEAKSSTVVDDLVGLARRAKELRLQGNACAAWQTLAPACRRLPKMAGAAKRKPVTPEGEFCREALLSAWLAAPEASHGATKNTSGSDAAALLDRCTDLDEATYEFAGKCAKALALRLFTFGAGGSDENKSAAAGKHSGGGGVLNVEVPVRKRVNLVNGNLSVMRYTSGRYLGVSRMINWVNGRCLHPQGILTNENAIVVLDKEFRVLREDTLVDVTTRPRKHTGWTGLEDVRLYDVDETSIRFVCTIFDHEGGGKPQTARCVALYQGAPTGGQSGVHRWEVVQVQPLARLDAGGEKNWLVFKPPVEVLRRSGDDDSTVYFIYHWYPRYHVRKLLANGTHGTVTVDQHERPGSFHQGSCAPIWIESIQCWLALIHLSWDCFFHRFVLLDQHSFAIKQIGPIMYFHTLGIEYACGMCLDHSSQNLVISYGRGDSSSHIIALPLSTALSTLNPPQTQLNI